MDEEIEEFRDEVVQWRGPRRQGAHPYPAAMKAKALRLAARLRTRGLTASAAAKLVEITAITLEGWQKAPERGGWVDMDQLPPHVSLAVWSTNRGSYPGCR